MIVTGIRIMFHSMVNIVNLVILRLVPLLAEIVKVFLKINVLDITIRIISAMC